MFFLSAQTIKESGNQLCFEVLNISICP